MNMDLYIGAVTSLMFLAGIVLVIAAVRESSIMRKRWEHKSRE
jgi:hypothetical protein